MEEGEKSIILRLCTLNGDTELKHEVPSGEKNYYELLSDTLKKAQEEFNNLLTDVIDSEREKRPEGPPEKKAKKMKNK